MPQSLNNLLYHIIFSTKNRESTINSDLKPKLHAYLAGICENMKGRPIIVGGVEDHVHIETYLPQTVTVADTLRDLKSWSSKWVHATYPDLGSFAWQAGYATFTVSQSHLKKVRDYIADQEKHHRRMSFQDEYREFLHRHGVEFDERYVWD
jgi:REP element-mobilizing transposase RayT